MSLSVYITYLIGGGDLFMPLKEPLKPVLLSILLIIPCLRETLIF